MFRWGKRENKAKLEHKLYLARENPEPIFDLSDCDLLNVPSGIYSLCQVFLKEHLNLAHNNLTSLSGGGQLRDLHLLHSLSINDNAFTNLPDELQLLINLKELYIQNNKIKKLPMGICNLFNLLILNASNNLLVELPQNLGNLTNLKLLVLNGNSKLKSLPKSICKARYLNELQLDSDGFKYPPPDVVDQGTEAIMKYICDDNNYEYIPQINVKDLDNKSDSEDTTYEHLEAKIWKLEKIKEQKLQEFLAIERHNELMNRQELELANSLKVNKEKLLADIVQQQNRLDESLDKVQQIKDMERFKLIEQLQEAEQNADVAINYLLEMNKEPLLQLLEFEDLEQEAILNAAYNEELRKNEILHAMEELLEQETLRFKEFDEFRIETSRSVLEQEMLADSHLTKLLVVQENRTKELNEKLLEDGELQKMAVGALLERSDARSWSLIQQVKLVEAQLASLTAIEMDKRKLEVDEQLNDLAEKRLNLSVLLMDLLEQQGLRRSQLMSTLQTLEENHTTAEDYWLIQYQQLIDRLPAGISEFQRNMNPSLVEALLMAGVLNYLPFLAKWAQTEDKLLDLTEEELKESGIKNAQDRQRMVDAFALYKKQKGNYHHNTTPSAPPAVAEEASAPEIETKSAYSTSECVVCMDAKCEIIYVPCGHFCCCMSCSSPIYECPMCRSAIERKIRVNFS